jgi:hypothetical protein
VESDIKLFINGMYCHPLTTKSILVLVDRVCGLLVVGFIGMKTPGAMKKGFFHLIGCNHCLVGLALSLVDGISLV